MTAGGNKVSTKRERSRMHCACRFIAACHPTCKRNGILTSCPRAHQELSFLPWRGDRLVGLFKGVLSSNVRRILLVKSLAFRVTCSGQHTANAEFCGLDVPIPQSLRWVRFASQRSGVLLVHKTPRPLLKRAPFLIPHGIRAVSKLLG